MPTDSNMVEVTPKAAKAQRGIHAMEVGGTLLQHVANAGRPVSMVGLSAASNLPLNQVFTYLVSLVRTGLIRRDVMTNRYEPGPLALKLGLRALQQLYPLQEAVELAAQLVGDENHGVFVAIWTEHGATVVQYHGPEMYLHVGLHVGSVMSLAHSSTGRLFSAYLSPQTINPLLMREFGKCDDTESSLTGIFAQIRRSRLSCTRSMPIPGVDSLTAPVFDEAGQIRLAITVFGPASTLDTSEDGRVARELLRVSERLSKSTPGGHIEEDVRVNGLVESVRPGG
jgi:DNA-binding IclR family transcriptional regulator